MFKGGQASSPFALFYLLLCLTIVSDMETSYLKMIRVGIDIGSTTAKIVVLGDGGQRLYSDYKRHNAKAREVLLGFIDELQGRFGDVQASVCITGSVGMGVSERCSLPFVQEVVAATRAVGQGHAGVRSMIDIGGEDAKIVFLDGGRASDLRMNSNCAGGTGAFIDQMAILLGVGTADLSALADKASNVYTIASRCGVFSKTDIQNLISKNVPKADIAASVFHAVAVQVVVTLAHGCDIKPPVLFCGGPLTFLPALRKAFVDYLNLSESDVVIPDGGHLMPAYGAALSAGARSFTSLSELSALVGSRLVSSGRPSGSLEPIFSGDADHDGWSRRMSAHGMPRAPLAAGREEVVVGIDSGSTTTKIVVLNDRGELVFDYYHNNDGDPIATARRGLELFADRCREAGTEAVVAGSCSTGYGEDLLKAAFRLDHGIIETMAHYMAARHIAADVSFILDIGGQDMKAIFVSGGVINRMEINEACSSGCGSFIETFAKSLGYTVTDFASAACSSAAPYDLGTRCTVFMNSKVKQALREGATVADIAAGLAYSVVKNCLYKVLRLKGPEELGSHIVVQGGTMRNDAVVRAFEKLTGRHVYRSDRPELMGAIGCALYARANRGRSVALGDMLASSACTTGRHRCHGCENGCMVVSYAFGNGNRYYSGNRCERIFTNRGAKVAPGVNAYAHKLEALFGRSAGVAPTAPTIGIPRCLNMYEEYPFWHTLFSRCGLRVVLSDPSSFGGYESCARMVMSDNICFPAKLAHSHIENLVKKGVGRIFMPFVVYEKLEGGQNSFNCPVVSGYSEVVKSEQAGSVPIDTPAITFKDRKLLGRQCEAYLASLGIGRGVARKAFAEAVAEFDRYGRELMDYNSSVLSANGGKRLVVLLAGRPYHSDPLIQHKLSDMIASMGVDVITEDIVRCTDTTVKDVNFVSQWAYTNRILKAAEWAGRQGANVQFMQMTSFGCGPDAFVTDEIRSLLRQHGKALTLLKIDDVSNLGSIRLRVRSVIDSMRYSLSGGKTEAGAAFAGTPVFGTDDRRRKIIAPFFTPFISPLIPPLMRRAGYDVENLPVSDAQSAEYGLKYANNEICYPATLIVGDIVKAFRSGRYDPRDTAVIMTQTGGQCRASNYISLIKRALTEAGYPGVPVISLASGSGISNDQPGFRVNWARILRIVLASLLYSDCLAKFYYASVVREREKGQAARLRDLYMERAVGAIEANDTGALWTALGEAAEAFDGIVTDRQAPRVGVVGEIFLKFNPFAQKDMTNWLTEQGIEVVPPMLTDFFMQAFVNGKVNAESSLERSRVPRAVMRWAYKWVRRRIDRANAAGSRFRYFTPFADIFDEAAEAGSVVSLCAQFGEGWLLPGEILSMARQGVTHVVSLQPFGCIANHIVSKGIEKRIKRLYPGLSILSLDFDSGVSDVNVRNRLLLFVDNLKECV